MVRAIHNAFGLATDAKKGAHLNDEHRIVICLEWAYVLCLKAFGTFRDIELYSLAIL